MKGIFMYSSSPSLRLTALGDTRPDERTAEGLSLAVLCLPVAAEKTNVVGALL